MKILMSLVNRNRKLFFRDKGMLVSAMITPIILIVLYATFLAKVYRDSFLSNMPETLPISDKLINGTVAGQLAAALLAVSCVTVTFCVNLTMVQDRVYGSRRDFEVSPVRKPMIYLGYFFSTVLNSLMVNMVALAACFVYVWKMGWFLRPGDVAFLIVDIILLVLFGTVLSSVVCYPLKTQGQMSAAPDMDSCVEHICQFQTLVKACRRHSVICRELMGQLCLRIICFEVHLKKWKHRAFQVR